MATIVFTSLSSVGAHHRHGAVDWRVARAMAPGIVAGALVATLVAGFVPTRLLAVFFAIFMLYASLQMFFEVKPKPSRQLPGAAGLFGAGAGIGALSSVRAAGGAFLSIPFLVRCNVPLKRAIGTAAANGFPIAVAGTIGYVLNGLRVSGLPDGSLASPIRRSYSPSRQHAGSAAGCESRTAAGQTPAHRIRADAAGNSGTHARQPLVDSAAHLKEDP
jgi:uncharacterized membrane protein YfcA